MQSHIDECAFISICSRYVSLSHDVVANLILWPDISFGNGACRRLVMQKNFSAP